MDWQDWFVISLMIAILILWVTEKLPLEVTALGGALALMVSGILSVEEAMLGFSNPATITVACMLILSGTLSQAGFTDSVNRFLRRLAGSRRKPALLLHGLTCGLMSAFVNNTAAVALMMPTSLRAARLTRTSPGRFLLTISYLSQLGGMCTLIGSSTNLIVHVMAKDAGLPGFSFFTLLPLGALLLLVGSFYVLFVDSRFPQSENPVEEADKKSSLGPFLAELRVPENSVVIGKALEDLAFAKADVQVVRILRPERNFFPTPATTIKSEDVLVVRGFEQDMIRCAQKLGLVFNRGKTPAAPGQEVGDLILVHALVPLGSPLAGKTLADSQFQVRFSGTVVGVRRLGFGRKIRLGTMRIRPGDTLLIETSQRQKAQLAELPDFQILEEATIPRRFKNPSALFAVVLGVFTLMITGLTSVATAALLGVLVLMGLRLVPTEDLMSFLNGKLLILLGCSFSFGYAAIKTGLVDDAAQGLMTLFAGASPWWFLVVIYLLTMVLTEFISNNATAILLVPIALATATQLGVDPMPYLVAITMGASTSFMTPTGYQTNAMIYGPGELSVKDFLRAGIPLNILVFLVGIFAIPYFWAF